MLSLTPDGVRALSPEEVKEVCGRIREELIDVVPRTGGHLASNLGVVEISCALVRAMDLPREKVIYDTGHQCYVHKILTGRGDAFSSLRQLNGLAGFPRRDESVFDAFGTGHSGTGLSAALGFARASAPGEWVAVVIGDGAFTGGMVFEALNNVRRDDRVIIILNDNGMSISRSTGSLKRSLNRLRTAGYYRVKDSFHSFLLRIPGIGRPLARLFKRFKDAVKHRVVPAGNLFEQYGLNYFGPADGNDPATVEFLIREAKTKDRPSLIHLCTKKGKGMRAAEHHPADYHGVPPRQTGTAQQGKTFTQAFGEAVLESAAKDDRVVAITAAMQSGVGLDAFAAKYPRRLFDTGIAEEHAMTFAAGLAAAGKKPVFAVYSTFFQRAYDQFVHDAALQRLPVTVCLDRAGISGEDGATHQGVLDVAMLMPLPDVVLYAPVSEKEVREDLFAALAEENRPSVLRWCKGCPDPAVAEAFPGKTDPELCSFPGKTRLTVITFGRSVSAALKAAGRLSKEGVGVDLVRFHRLKGYDEDFAMHMLADLPGNLLFVEEGVLNGGFSQTLLAKMTEAGLLQNRRAKIRALPTPFVPHGTQEQLLAQSGLDPDSLAKEGKSLAAGSGAL